VTCPLIRIHPAIVAHAAATVAAMMPGRFFLGVGTGENLNEHVHGARWPAPDERLDMLDEAIDVMRLLWQGGYQTHRGKHYTVERARLYTLPDERPPIVVAAKQPNAAKLAGEKGDGYMNVAPDKEIVQKFEAAGGSGPRYGKVTVAFVDSKDEAKKVAKERWPNTALGGSLSVDLALPADFEAAAENVREEDLEDSIVVGTDLDAIREQIGKFEDAGFTHVALHDITERQAEFIDFAKQLL